MHRILAAVDLSDSTESVLKFAAELAQTENASISVLYAMPPALPVDAMASAWGMSTVAQQGDEMARYEASLERLQQMMTAIGLWGSECLCVRGPVEKAIRQAAEQVHADLIITGGHAHGRFFHAMFGSVREALLSHAPCPVLVVPKHEQPS